MKASVTEMENGDICQLPPSNLRC